MLNFWKKKPQPAPAGAEPAATPATIAPDAADAGDAARAIAEDTGPDAAPGKAGWRERLRNSGIRARIVVVVRAQSAPR